MEVTYHKNIANTKACSSCETSGSRGLGADEIIEIMQGGLVALEERASEPASTAGVKVGAGEP